MRFLFYDAAVLNELKPLTPPRALDSSSTRTVGLFICEFDLLSRWLSTPQGSVGVVVPLVDGQNTIWTGDAFIQDLEVFVFQTLWG